MSTVKLGNCVTIEAARLTNENTDVPSEQVAIGDSLRRLIEARGTNVNRLAIAAGMSSSHLSQILSGRIQDPGINVIRKIAAALGASLEEVERGTLTAAVISDNHDAPREEHGVDVPLLGVSAGGPPIEAEEMKHETYSLLHHLYKPGRYVIRLLGQSMWPTYHSGDLLLIDPKERVPEGKVGLVRVAGETTVKRVFKRKGGSVELKADNPTFPSIVADDPEEVQILGRVLRIVEGERE